MYPNDGPAYIFGPDERSRILQINNKIKAWRQPTKAEIKFGYGAIHWGEFEIEDWLKSDGSFYKWRKFDGLRYNR